MNKNAISPGTQRPMFAAGSLRHPLLSALPARTEAIVASHERSRGFGLSPKDSCDFASPLASDFKITLESSARLYAQAQPVMELLLEQVMDTGSMVLLADNKGTILRTVGSSTFMEQAARVALRPGMCWAEASKGTNAIGTALMLESEFIVHSNEHYIHSNHFLTCSAAPIMDHSGNVVGILDVSGDERSFHPHTLGLVKMSARNIENYWFCDNFSRSVRLHFHTQPELIGTVAEGIIAIGPEGKVLGVNRAGMALLQTSGAALRVQGIGPVLGLSFAQLMDHLRCSHAAPLKIQSTTGLVLYARAHIGDPGLRQTYAGAQVDTPRSLAFSATPAERAAARHVAINAVPMQAGAVVQRSVPARRLVDLHHGDATVHAVVGKVRRALDKNISIMVLGDTGTGKEWLAHAIHHDSQRRHAPFVVIDCAAVPEQSMEVELFGLAAAVSPKAKLGAKPGKLLQAQGGSLFLDEIGDMPMAMQTRMLRVLQERSVTPIGATHGIPLDIQLICSSHRNLREMVRSGTFREDLYYRLNGLVVQLPRLRGRGDFKALCDQVLHDVSPRHPMRLHPGLLPILEGYAWPGNLRQLGNVLRTAVSMCMPANEIVLEHLSDDFRDDVLAHSSDHPVALVQRSTMQGEPVSGGVLQATQRLGDLQQLHTVETQTIRQAVLAADGNISKAAKQLNISRNTVYRKLKAAQDQRVDQDADQRVGASK